QNVGNASAKNAEVYALQLRRRRADDSWEQVRTFAPMNLRWSDIDQMYFPSIAADTRKHCNVAHVTDPAQRVWIGEEVARLKLTDEECNMAFDVVSKPNHQGHIVGPGDYELDILVSAENARPDKRTVRLSLRGPWHDEEGRMLRDGVGISVVTDRT